MTDRAAQFPPLAPERAAFWSKFGTWDTTWFPKFLGMRLEELREVARGEENLIPAIRAALKDRCSMGEVCGAMKDVFGGYKPGF